jgi:hypothetical protein
VLDRLTPEQHAAFDDGPPIERRLRPSGDQTAEQARNFAVDSFRAAFQFYGVGVASEAHGGVPLAASKAASDASA